jgi:hypothetical protein
LSDYNIKDPGLWFFKLREVIVNSDIILKMDSKKKGVIRDSPTAK